MKHAKLRNGAAKSGLCQQQQAQLTGQLTQLKTANERLSNQVIQAQGMSKAQFDELLRLRGKSGLAQADSHELANLKSTLAEQKGKTEQLTNAMGAGLEMAVKMTMTIAQGRLDLMKQTLGLTVDQARSIRELMEKHARRKVEMTLEAMNGKMTQEQRLAIAEEGSTQENEIKALLTPEQLAAYPQFEQAEKAASAERSANYDAKEVAVKFDLSKEQQEQVRAAFYRRSLNEPASGAIQEAIAAARKSGNVEEVIARSIEKEKSALEEKVKILESILTPEQIGTYRKEGMKGSI